MPSSLTLVPHLVDSFSTILSPRPPVAPWAGSPSSGTVGAPPSLTETRTLTGSICQATRICAPGSGAACRSALLNSSLMTSATSQTAES